MSVMRKVKLRGYECPLSLNLEADGAQVLKYKIASMFERAMEAGGEQVSPIDN
jgi:hypothetical protein